MKVLRATIVHPRSGQIDAALGIFQELDRHLATQPGFIESYELENNVAGKTLGRVGVWESREAVDHAANDHHTLAVRSRLLSQCHGDCQELIFEVVAERHAASSA